MKHLIFAPRFTALVAILFLATSAQAQRQMEKLGRGVVAVRQSSTQMYVGWRLLATDPAEIAFNLYRVSNGATNKLNGTPITNSCNFVDGTLNFAQTNSYFVRPVLDSVEQASSSSFHLPANLPTQQYFSVPIQMPPGGTSPASTDGEHAGGPYSYTANDCSVADLDGDGEYEIILKWEPTNAQDNSNSGHTGPVYLDAYRLDGTRLWQINLGKNIRAGAHYTQFMVYDLDGDGRAEVACKTAPGTIDGQGNFVIMGADNPNTIYTNSNGYILTGPEYLTIFDGLTGAELATTNYIPGRGNVSSWGDSYGNRVDRFLACVAHLDGVRPSLVMCRGYYTRAVLAAWDWRNGQLTQRWVFDSNNPGSGTAAGQGNHNLSVADVDGDGKDEIIYGSATINDNGAIMYATGYGHGDALHVSDADPDRPGLEVWTIHEPSNVPGADLHNAQTGQLLFTTAVTPAGVEGPGRGVASDVWAGNRGYEMWGGGGFRDRYGNNLGRTPGSANFLAWWDADLTRELLDGNHTDKYGTGSDTRLLTASGASSNNGTKSTPGLSADILGDWREEIIFRASDNGSLRIYISTNIATTRLYTLMHDPQYRAAIAWQNVAYNQPPHPGFLISVDMHPPPVAPLSDADLVWRGASGSSWDASLSANWFTNRPWSSNHAASVFNAGNTVLFDLTGSNSAPVNLVGNLSPGKVTVHTPIARNYTFSGEGMLEGSMQLVKAGAGTLTINNTNTYSGDTRATEGVLRINGTLAQSRVSAHGNVWGTRVGGIGVVGGLEVQRGVMFDPGVAANSPGNFTVSNSFSLTGGASNVFDLSDDPTGVLKTNDAVQVFGNVVLTGTNIIHINKLNGFLGNGLYPLIAYSGTLSGGIGNLVLSGSFEQPVILTNPPGMIALASVLPPGPPAQPLGLSATAVGLFQINLAWQDNADDESVYLVERSTDNNNFSQIVSLAANTTNYPNSGLTPGATYYYRVRATNIVGTSDYSPVASATLPTELLPLTWQGDGSANTWDMGGAANWFNGSSLVVFGNGARVTFDQSGSATPSINLVGQLQPASITVNASQNYTFSGAGSIVGTNTLVKTGTGQLTINASNFFNGGTILSNGTVILGNIPANARGLGIGTVTFMGGTLQFNGFGGNTGTTWGTCTNPVVVPAGQTGSVRLPPRFSFNSRLTGSGTLNLVDDYVRCDIGGNWASFTGRVNVGPRSGSSEFRLNNSAGYASTAFYLSNGVTLYNINGNDVTIDIGELQGAAGSTLGPGNGSSTGPLWRVGAKNTDATFSGTIVNAGTTRITKLGTGTWTLTGANTYDGATTISAGRLNINGDHSGASGPVTVAAPATLGGNGTIGSSTTNNGTLSPGTSIGRLTFNGTLRLNPGSRTYIEISKTELTNDVVRVLTPLAYNAQLIVTNITGNLTAGDSFRIFDAPSYSGSFVSTNLPSLSAGLAWDTSGLATNGTIKVINTTPPSFATVSFNGGQLTIQATGGVASVTYYLLASTNLELPAASWTRVATNTFDGTGTFVFSNLVDFGNPQTYYRIQLP
jgi:autotransporter-associated beta strand protein